MKQVHACSDGSFWLTSDSGYEFELIRKDHSLIRGGALEPQTSTVSICWADWERMRWSENK
jgi:hypothetical protein